MGALWPSRASLPNSEGALAEARRCLEAGASGFKLHPRSDAFGLPHPVVEEVVALAHERRAPVLFHAGRGIPHLGEAVVDLARALPGRAPDPGPRGHQRPRLDRRRGGRARRTCSSTPPGGTSPTSFSSTRRSRPGRSSTPATCPTRRDCSRPSCSCASRAPLATVTTSLRSIAGGQLARLVAGEDPVDVGPAPGPDAVGRRVIEAERVVTYCAAGLQVAFRGMDPSEPIALARLACRTCRDGDVRELLSYVDALLAIGQESAAAHPDAALRDHAGDAAGDDARGHPGGRAAVRHCVTLVTEVGARRATVTNFCSFRRVGSHRETGGAGAAPNGAIATAIVRRARCPAPQAADRKEESTSHEAASELARPSRRHGAGRALLSHLARRAAGHGAFECAPRRATPPSRPTSPRARAGSTCSPDAGPP